MRGLDANVILEVWEGAHCYHPVDQALALLTAAEPERSRDELAALSLGQRDARLLALREATFGNQLSGRSTCPRCKETVEFELACSALRTPAAEVRERALRCEGHTFRLRPLNSLDLAAAVSATDVPEARRLLLQRCVIEARHADTVVDTNALPEALGTAVADAALAADPQAELLFELNCPACHHQWQALLDITHILWSEIAARAQRALMEVHLLARAYGWREADILGMSPARRASYLHMVGL